MTMSLASRITATLLGRRKQEVDVPVMGLRVLPHGPVFAFDTFRMEGNTKRILVIGADIGCDVAIHDETVSGLHCLLERHGDRVLVHDCESKNGTRVNGVALKAGELRPGSLLTLGRVSLVAYGPDMQQRPRVTLAAASLDEFLRFAVNVHGSLRAAAEALGLPYSTLRGWLKKRVGGNGGNGASPR
jgi:pSer/pThr/pTyr-binding forkhead associated (FHA) protein